MRFCSKCAVFTRLGKSTVQHRTQAGGIAANETQRKSEKEVHCAHMSSGCRLRSFRNLRSDPSSSPITVIAKAAVDSQVLAVMFFPCQGRAPQLQKTH